MASTYSPNLRIELIGTGDQSGLWGDTTNTNLGSLIEQAICGYESIAMTDTDYTLTALNGSPDESRNAVIKMTSVGSLTANRNVIIPGVEKTYTFKNATTGNFGLVVKTSGGAGITVPAGQTMQIYCDGTDTFQCATYLNSPTLASPTISGTTTVGGTINSSSGATFSGTVNSGVSSGILTVGNTSASYANYKYDGSLSLNGGTYYALLTAYNFNSYAPTLTGTGASGTWNINIGGSAVGVRDGDNLIEFAWTSPSLYYRVDGGSYSNTWPIGITGNAATATSATSATSATTATNVSGGGTVSASTVTGTSWVRSNSNMFADASLFTGYGDYGGAGCTIVGMDSSIGFIRAVTSGGTWRWFRINEYGPTIIGAGTPYVGTFKLTVNGDTRVDNILNVGDRVDVYNHVYCKAGSTGSRGWALICSDNSLGAWYYQGISSYLTTELLGSQIGISFFYSDIRAKTDIAPATQEILPLIDQIEFIDFRYKPMPKEENPGEKRLQQGGVSAQQLQTIKPEWVDEMTDGGLMLNAPLMLTNAYKAIQELHGIVKQQQAQIDALTAEVAALK